MEKSREIDAALRDEEDFRVWLEYGQLNPDEVTEHLRSEQPEPRPDTENSL